MPNPHGSPLTSFSVAPTTREDGKPALKVSYTYEDGFVFETEYTSWAVVGTICCEQFDQQPPQQFNPRTDLFEYAW